jgi:hypothetical protein
MTSMTRVIISGAGYLLGRWSRSRHPHHLPRGLPT